MYCNLHFAGIPLTLIGMSILNWFTNNPNVDVVNAIWPLITFPVNYDGIKDGVKYWSPYPMIRHIINGVVSSSYMYGYSPWPLMN